ncbi:hypothetical protein AOLI_G00222150 [Acnodon oligacanthus]
MGMRAASEIICKYNTIVSPATAGSAGTRAVLQKLQKLKKLTEKFTQLLIPRELRYCRPNNGQRRIYTVFVLKQSISS